MCLSFVTTELFNSSEILLDQIWWLSFGLLPYIAIHIDFKGLFPMTVSMWQPSAAVPFGSVPNSLTRFCFLLPRPRSTLLVISKDWPTLLFTLLPPGNLIQARASALAGDSYISISKLCLFFWVPDQSIWQYTHGQWFDLIKRTEKSKYTMDKKDSPWTHERLGIPNPSQKCSNIQNFLADMTLKVDTHWSTSNFIIFGLAMSNWHNANIPKSEKILVPSIWDIQPGCLKSLHLCFHSSCSIFIAD